MKKYILISFILIFLFILIPFFLPDTKINVENKVIKTDVKEINYPFFNNKKIDNNIWKYLNDKLLEDEENVFLDYDYKMSEEYINIIFYLYSSSSGKLKTKEKNINVNKTTGEIISNKSSNKRIEYDIITNKKVDPNGKMIAFTFDDGPNYNTSKIIDILNKYSVKATFFVLGSRIEQNSEILKKMSQSGMEIGNHTYSHKLLSKLTPSEINEEITKTNNLIYKYTNKYPTLVRPSYGTISKKIKATIAYPLIIWDIDTLDWKYHNSSRIASSIIKKIKDGDIILMHDIYSSSVNALDKVIPVLLNEGYQILTVSELFYYKSVNLEKGQIYSKAS